MRSSHFHVFHTHLFISFTKWFLPKCLKSFVQIEFFLILSCRHFLCIMDIRPLSDIYLQIYFLPIYGLSFLIEVQKALILLKPNLSFFFSFHGLFLVLYLKMLYSIQGHKDSGLYSTTFMILTLRVRSLTYFELLFVYMVRYMVGIQLSWPSLLKKLFFLFWIVLASMSNQLTIREMIYFWTPTSVPLIYRLIFVPILIPVRREGL